MGDDTPPPPAPTASAVELAKYLGAKVADLNAAKVLPMLCEREATNAKILARQGWLYELKLDGVRIVADKRGDRVALYYRKQRDATENYREIADAVKELSDERVVLDGEIVAFDEQGRPDFQRLGHRISTTGKSARRAAVPVVYVVFDVLAVGPYDIRGFPIEARKEILSRIIPAEGAPSSLLRQHPTFKNGVELFRLCREHKLEGVVAKRLGTTYKVGERSIDWLKIKCELDAEFVVIGWTEGEHSRSRLGALDLGAYEGDRLVFRGRVGSGLHDRIINVLLEQLLPTEVPYPVAEGKYSPKPKRHHCDPRMVVSVRYGGFSLDPSGARFLRFPVFRGIREDVDPKDCTVAPDDGIDLNYVEKGIDYGSDVVEEVDTSGPSSTDGPTFERDEDSSPPPPSVRNLKPAAATTTTAARTRRIHITGGEQGLLSDGTTKNALCTYFEAVSPALLRHTRDRVCQFIRPDGTYMWPPPKWTPTFVRTAIFRAGPREIRGFIVDSVDALLFAVEAGGPSLQHGAVDDDRPEIADFVALRVIAAEQADRVRGALAVRDLAKEIGLPSAAKSCGPRAIEVLIGVGHAPASAVAPLGTILARIADEAIGEAVSIEAVDAVTTPFTPCLFPQGRLRAEGDPITVAVPLTWDELASGELDLAALDFEAGIARAEASKTTDALNVVKGKLSVDVGAAAKKIERLLAKK